MWTRFRVGVALATLALTGNVDAAPTSCSAISRQNVARCAVSHSPAVNASQRQTAAARGRSEAARAVLPENPVLGISAGRRETRGAGASLDFSAQLSQQLEIGGQRGARRRAARANLRAQREQALLEERRVAADAWQSYFDVLAAREDLRLVRRFRRNAAAIEQAVSARAREGAASSVEAELAAAVEVSARRLEIGAARRLETRRAQLASRVGLDPARPQLAVSGQLEPISGVEAFARAAMARRESGRPEVRVLAARREQALARAELYRSRRIPNLTVSVFAAREGADDRIFGAGLALPIPLPHPLGRSYAGEIEEAEALGQSASSRLAERRRALRLTLVTALAEFQSRKRELGAFTPQRIQRAEKALDDIGRELAELRLPVRDALMTAQALMELLRGRVEARHALCTASVELARAASFPFQAGAS